MLVSNSLCPPSCCWSASGPGTWPSRALFARRLKEQDFAGRLPAESHREPLELLTHSENERFWSTRLDLFWYTFCFNQSSFIFSPFRTNTVCYGSWISMQGGLSVRLTPPFAWFVVVALSCRCKWTRIIYLSSIQVLGDLGDYWAPHCSWLTCPPSSLTLYQPSPPSFIPFPNLLHIHSSGAKTISR